MQNIIYKVEYGVIMNIYSVVGTMYIYKYINKHINKHLALKGLTIMKQWGLQEMGTRYTKHKL